MPRDERTIGEAEAWEAALAKAAGMLRATADAVSDVRPLPVAETLRDAADAVLRVRPDRG